MMSWFLQKIILLPFNFIPATLTANPKLAMAEASELPSTTPPKKKRKKAWIILAIIIIALLLFNPISLMFFGIFTSMGLIKKTELKLQKPAIYQPVAERLATYCQSDTNLFPAILSFAWMPPEISHLGHPWGDISPDYASVEFGGGFYHFGYYLKRDTDASTIATNVWHLFLAREEQPLKPLTTFNLAASQHYTAADLEKLVGATFDESITSGKLGAYRSKVMLQLKFGQTSEAADTCREWIKAQPNSWLPRFTFAHVQCRLGQTNSAAVEFADWVQAHKDFSDCICLALFYYREGWTNQAVEAVRLALAQPLTEEDDTASKFYLAENGALIAFAGGDYDLAQSMCDKMLADSEKEKWWRREAFRTKAAAAFMKGDQPAAIELMKSAQNANENEPFSHAPNAKADQKLLDAIQNKNTELVRDLTNWIDSMEKWYSPFETDESGFHGGDLRIATPYPASWKSDEMTTNFYD
jgi:tetratricopeptide (TPR) repeat protein